MATNDHIFLFGNENVLSTTRPTWILALCCRRTEWNISISMLYLFAGKKLVFHDYTVKLSIVSTWGSNYLTAQHLHNVQNFKRKPPIQAVKIRSRPTADYFHYLLILARAI